MVTPKAKAVKKAPAKKATGAVKAPNPKSYKGPREPKITQDVRAAIVDEVPPKPSSSSRKYRYAQVMAKIREEVGPGVPVILAEFVGPTGASSVRRALLSGARPVDGRVEEWQLDARRMESGGSILFATLLPTSTD